jgi:hypothetical protein
MIMVLIHDVRASSVKGLYSHYLHASLQLVAAEYAAVSVAGDEA